MDRLSRVNFKISDRKAWSKKVNHEKSAEVIVAMKFCNESRCEGPNVCKRISRYKQCSDSSNKRIA